MLSSQLFDYLADIRRNDKDFSHLVTCFRAIDSSQYYDHLQLILETAQKMYLKNTTKFLAKKYFDIFFCKYPGFCQQNPILAVITCLRTAVKFNQATQRSQNYTIEYCIEQSCGTISQEQFFNCQIKLLSTLEFRLRVTSPYEFQVVKQLFPEYKKIFSILDCMIDFALTVPELRTASSQAIFFGALIYSWKTKKGNDLSFTIIKAITFKWRQSSQIAIILEQKLGNLLDE